MVTYRRLTCASPSTRLGVPGPHRRCALLPAFSSECALLFLTTYHLQQFPEGPKQTSGPFWVGSGLAFVSALIALVLIPEAKMDGMTQEDERFREYLQANGYDVSQMGTHSQLSSGVDSAYEVDTRGEDKKASQMD